MWSPVHCMIQMFDYDLHVGALLVFSFYYCRLGYLDSK